MQPTTLGSLSVVLEPTKSSEELTGHKSLLGKQTMKSSDPSQQGCLTKKQAENIQAHNVPEDARACCSAKQGSLHTFVSIHVCTSLRILSGGVLCMNVSRHTALQMQCRERAVHAVMSMSETR